MFYSSVRQEQIHALRQKMHAIVGHAPDIRIEGGIDLPEYFAGPLGVASLPRGGVVESQAPVVLLVGLLAHMLRSGLYIAVVGWPEVSLAELAGGDLSRVVVVPDPGPEPLTVVSALLEGMDVVVYRGRVTPSAARQLKAKARKGEGTLIVHGGPVAGAGTKVEGRIVGFRGCGTGGVGRISAIDIEARVVRGGLVHEGLVTLCGP